MSDTESSYASGTDGEEEPEREEELRARTNRWDEGSSDSDDSDDSVGRIVLTRDQRFESKLGVLFKTLENELSLSKLRTQLK